MTALVQNGARQAQPKSVLVRIDADAGFSAFRLVQDRRRCRVYNARARLRGRSSTFWTSVVIPWRCGREPVEDRTASPHVPIDRDAPREVARFVREGFEPLADEQLALEAREHVELGDDERVEARDPRRVTQRDEVEPPTAPRAPGGGAVLMALRAEALADRVVELGRERAAPDPRGVRLEQANDAAEARSSSCGPSPRRTRASASTPHRSRVISHGSRAPTR
jgi:hypothetical protein